jgi:hypothetical protein
MQGELPSSPFYWAYYTSFSSIPSNPAGPVKSDLGLLPALFQVTINQTKEEAISGDSRN